MIRSVVRLAFITVALSWLGICQTAGTQPQADQLEGAKFELEIASVGVAGIGLAISWNKDRALKRQQYVEQIRRAAGQAIAKLERWSAISDSLFFELQPAITDADVRLAESKDVIATRDKLWRDLLDKETARSQTILAEEIELAYVDLYGYDPQVRDLFRVALQRLRQIDEGIDKVILQQTQTDVLAFLDKKADAIHSASLGNCLRRVQSKEAMDDTIVPFQHELARLIDATDLEIFEKKVRLQNPDHVFTTESVLNA